MLAAGGIGGTCTVSCFAVAGRWPFSVKVNPTFLIFSLCTSASASLASCSASAMVCSCDSVTWRTDVAVSLASMRGRASRVTMCA